MVMSPAERGPESDCASKANEQLLRVNLRPILLSERAPHIKKPVTVWQYYKIEFGHGFQMGGRHQDILVD
jgi:hypothetical protein